MKMNVLNNWYVDWRDHPAETIVDKRLDKNTKEWIPQRNHGTAIDPVKYTFPLTNLQSTYNVYEPIEAYYEEWEHIKDKNGTFIKAYPKPGTRRRQDLPSLSEQWRADAKSRSLT